MNNNKKPVKGWVGGFDASNALFNYPNPNLSSLHMLDNMANIGKLQRQQAVLWPEFSWETRMGQPDPKRCFQLFAPDISRIGYTNEGRIFSIICPQQGAYSPLFGALNVEVTVTGQRGWVNEDDNLMAADMSVVGKIWFSPCAQNKSRVKHLLNHFTQHKLPFPTSKANAIVVTTHNPGAPKESHFPLRSGQSNTFDIPSFAQHDKEAWGVAHLHVQIGSVHKIGHPAVDEFNQLFIDIFNMAAGNMLQKNNILSWNIWLTAPELVDQGEWTDHAEKWRDAIDAGHGSPNGPGTAATYFDGSPFEPWGGQLDPEETLAVKKLKSWLLSKEPPLLKKRMRTADAERVMIKNFIKKHGL